MKLSEENKLLKEWKHGNYYNGFERISTEFLDYIVGRIDSEVFDEQSGTSKRDTKNDYLITQFFYEEIEDIHTGMKRKEYRNDLSENFIKNAEKAIETAKANGDTERTEKLTTILKIASQLKTGIEREEASDVIHNFRYMHLNGEKIKIEDEKILAGINRFLEELDEEASAGLNLNNSIYTYITNAKDKDDLLKRLEVVNAKLQEYEKEKSEQSLGWANQSITLAVEDFENGDILGIDKDVEGR